MRWPSPPASGRVLLAGFFACAAFVLVLAALTMLVPGTPLDALWVFKRSEQSELLRWSFLVGATFAALAFLFGACAMGVWLGRRIAWSVAMLIFTANAVGNVMRLVAGAWASGLIGIAVSALVLFWLTRPKTRAQFRT